jgi:tetratricopeptide (TPR) repeat protein
MMSARLTILWMILPFFACLAFLSESFAQTNAADWVKAGLNAAPADAKIRAFEQAIKLDPNYVEAYYYLGLAYKARGRYEEAETTLNKAYFKNPYALNNDIKTRILFELGSIYQQLGRTEKAKEALLGAKNLSTANNAKGRICYDLGQIYLKEGDISNALAEFRLGKSLLPQNSQLFDEAIQSAEGKKNLDDKYNESMSLMRAERFEDAAGLLKEIIQTDPNFKDSAEKLEEATRLAQNSIRTKRIAALYSQAVNKARDDELNDASRLFAEVISLDPGYKDAEQRLQDLQERTRRNRTTATPTPREVATAQRPAETQPRQPVAPSPTPVTDNHEPLYREALSKMQAGNWQASLTSFEKLNDVAPDYRNVRQLLSAVRDSMALANQQELAKLYREGETAMQNGDWQLAVQTFENVQSLDANFREVKNKLADARFNLSKTSQKVVTVKSSFTSRINMTTLAASAAVLLILPVVGLLFFSPVTRARFHLLQGKYDRAEVLYEKMLEKHPGKIKIYPVLANIYLLKSRRDDRALKLYETILRLNIPTNKREAINSILATHYLTQGRTDMSAIQILEKELDTKMRKLKVYQ